MEFPGKRMAQSCHLALVGTMRGLDAKLGAWLRHQGSLGPSHAPARSDTERRARGPGGQAARRCLLPLEVPAQLSPLGWGCRQPHSTGESSFLLPLVPWKH